MRLCELVKIAAVTMMLALFAGCGGGGSPSPVPGPTTRTTASGTASAGLIKNGTINIYAANSNGSKGALLASTTTDSQGQYTVTVQNYQGPVVIEATGSYVDEATSTTTTIPASAPLRAGAVVTGDGSTIKIAVTPLTELAYRQAVAAAGGGTPIGTAISNANNQVSSSFGIDILEVQPVEATQTAMEGATTDQRAYVLALAGISQMSMTGNLSLADTIVQMMQSTAPASDVTTAKNDFLANNSRNRTGYKRMTATLSLAGLGSLKAGAVDFTVSLPPTSLVNTSNGALASCEYALSDPGSGNSVLTATSFTPGTRSAGPRLRIIVINSNLVSDGRFATLHFNVPLAAAAKDLQVQNLAVKDQNGATITGVTLTVQ